MPQEEYEKIPKEKIEFYKQNKDKNYTFVFDASKSLKEQNISIKTNAIIVSLFRDYFATTEQKEKITKLQSMLSKTLEFASKVRESAVGKIFFKKPLKELKMDGTALPSPIIEDKEL